MLPLRVRVDLRAMAMKGHSICLKAPRSELHNDLIFNIIAITHVGEVLALC